MFRCSFARVSVLLSVAVITVAACGTDPETAKQEYLRNGDKFFAEKNYQSAIVEYRNALEQDARFGQARYKLAQAYAATQNLTRARAEFIRAADLLSGDAEAQIAAARALLQNGEFQDAKSRAERALAIDPKNGDAHLVRGSAAAGLKDLDGALDAFEEGLVADPEQSELHVSLGMLQSARGQQAEAEAAFKQAVIVNPSSVPSRVALANYYWSTGRPVDAEQALLEAVKLEPAHASANRALALLYTATNRAAEAEGPLKRAAEGTADAQPKLVLADYYFGRQRYDDALQVLEKVAADPQAFAVATARVAGIQYQLGNRERAYGLLDDVLEKEPRNTQILVLRGKWQLQENDVPGAYETAMSAVKGAPEAWTAHELLGDVQAARRQPDEAQKAFAEVLRLNPRAFRAQMALAELNLSAGRYDDAIRFAEEATQARRSSGLARAVLTRALLASGDLARARAAMQPILAGSPNNATVQVLLGQLELKGGDRAAAKRAFERAAAIDKRSTDAVAGLVAVDRASNQLPAAVARVTEHVTAAPEDPRAFFLAARTHVGAGQFGEAEKAIRKALELDPAYMEAYGLLARVYIGQKRLDEARKEYEGIVARQPSNIAAHTMVALLFEQQQRRDEAKRAYEKILSIDSRAVVAANNLAYFHAEEGTNLDQALNLAQTAKAGRPDDADINDTLGWVYYKRNLPGLAIDPFEQSIKINPRNAVVHYHLGLAYLKLGDKDKARAAFEQALELQPNFDGAAEAKKALGTL